MAALIEVRPMKARGASRMRSATPCASPCAADGVQSTTIVCSLSEAHSMKHRAMRPMAPAVMARTTRGSAMAAA